MYCAPAKSVSGHLEAGVGCRQSPPVGAPACRALLARFLAAPLRFLFPCCRSRVPTFFVSTSRFPVSSLSGDRYAPCGVSPVPGTHRFCPVALCRASDHRRSPSLVPSLESLLESPVKERSLGSGSVLVLSNLVPRVRGKNFVHQAEPPYLVRLQYNWEVAWYPRGCHLRQIHPLPFIQ
jgi:hypothetical protein